MGNHIVSRICYQTGRQLLQQLAVQNRHIGLQPPVDQRMLDAVVGQNGKIRHLGPGTGGGGNGHQLCIPFCKVGHGLGAVHGTAPAQGHDQIRPKGPELCRALRRQLHRGIRLHIMENLHLLRFGAICHPACRAVFIEIGIRHQKQPFRPKIRQPPDRTGAGNDLRSAIKFVQENTAFS